MYNLYILCWVYNWNIFLCRQDLSIKMAHWISSTILTHNTLFTSKISRKVRYICFLLFFIVAFCEEVKLSTDTLHLATPFMRWLQIETFWVSDSCLTLDILDSLQLSCSEDLTATLNWDLTLALPWVSDSCLMLGTWQLPFAGYLTTALYWASDGSVIPSDICITLSICCNGSISKAMKFLRDTKSSDKSFALFWVRGRKFTGDDNW